MTTRNRCQPLNYPCIRTILGFFSLSKRRQLVRKVPSIRKINLHISFSYVNCIVLTYKDNIYMVQIGDVQWKFLKQDYIKLDLLNARGVVKQGGLDFSVLGRILSFYLERGGTRVRQMFVEDFLSFPVFITEIEYLEVRVKGTQRMPLELFHLSKVRTLSLVVYTLDNGWTEEVSNINCDHLKIKTSQPYPDDYVPPLTVSKLEINEKYTTEQKFIEMCEKMRRLEHENDSFYQGGLGDSSLESEYWDQYWNRLKEKFQMEDGNDKYFVFKTDDPDREILVQRWQDMLFTPPFRYQVKIVKKQTEPRPRQSKFTKGNILDWLNPKHMMFHVPFLAVLISLHVLIIFVSLFVLPNFYNPYPTITFSTQCYQLISLIFTLLIVFPVYTYYFHGPSDGSDSRGIRNFLAAVMYILVFLIICFTPFTLLRFSDNVPTCPAHSNVYRVHRLIDDKIVFSCSPHLILYRLF